MKFNLSAYQRYYILAAYIKKMNYSKLRYDGMHYHHIKPKSIFGEDNNLIICCPVELHARLHYHIWKYYEEIGDTESMHKMKYAYNNFTEKFDVKYIPHKNAIIDEAFIWKKIDPATYKYLMHSYSIDTREKFMKYNKMSAELIDGTGKRYDRYGNLITPFMEQN